MRPEPRISGYLWIKCIYDAKMRAIRRLDVLVVVTD